MTNNPEFPDGTELVSNDVVLVSPESDFESVQLVGIAGDGRAEIISETDIYGGYGLAAFPSTFVPTDDET